MGLQPMRMIMRSGLHRESGGPRREEPVVGGPPFRFSVVNGKEQTRFAQEAGTPMGDARKNLARRSNQGRRQWDDPRPFPGAEDRSTGKRPEVNDVVSDKSAAGFSASEALSREPRASGLVIAAAFTPTATSEARARHGKSVETMPGRVSAGLPRRAP